MKIIKIKMDNENIPINIKKLDTFLKNLNIDTNKINIDNWISLIDDSYCKYFDGKKICCIKIRSDNLFCSKHINKKIYINDKESVISEQTLVDKLEKLNIEEEISLNNNNINILLNMIENIKNIILISNGNIKDYYEELDNAIINFKNFLYNNQSRTFIEFSYIIQYFESINDIYNDLKNTFLINDREKWIYILDKWKDSMNELIKDFYNIPEEYILNFK